MILKVEWQKPMTLHWNKGCAVSPKLSELCIVRKTQKALVLKKETDLKDDGKRKNTMEKL